MHVGDGQQYVVLSVLELDGGRPLLQGLLEDNGGLEVQLLEVVQGDLEGAVGGAVCSL